MKIGIIGSGHIGGNLGIHLANAGHQVLFSSRHPEELTDLVNEAGENAENGTVEEAAEFGDVIILSVPFWAVEEIAENIDPVAGKTIIETTNPYPGRDGDAAQKVRDSGKPASLFVAEHFPKAHVVKAFNVIYYEHLRNQTNREGELRAIPFAGDHDDSITLAETLIKEIGFDPVYIGKLSESHIMDVDQPLYTKDLTADEVQQVIKKNQQ